MGVLTPDQIKALNDADTLKLVIILIIMLIPVLVLLLRFNRENQKERNALELRQTEQQIIRDKADAAQQEAFQKQTQSQQEVNIRLTVAVEKLVDEIKVSRAATIGVSDEIMAQGTNIAAMRNEIAGVPSKTAAVVVTSQQAVADQLLAAAKANSESLASAVTKLGQLPTTDDIQRVLRDEVATLLRKFDGIEQAIGESKSAIIHAYETAIKQLPAPASVPVPVPVATPAPTSEGGAQ